MTENPSYRLNEDVLIEIFRHLSDKDLVQCEATCRQWRHVLRYGIPWKRLLLAALDSSPSWQQAFQLTGLVKSDLQLKKCKSIYRAMYSYLSELDSNWRRGRQLTVLLSTLTEWSDLVDIGNNCIAN